MKKKKSPAKSSSSSPHALLHDPVTSYAKAVLAGEIIAGPHVRNACRRHLDDLVKGHERGLYFDIEAVHRVLRFCRTVCRLKDGQFDGKPFIPHASQEFILGSIFGWKKADGFRRYRRAYIEMGKGNGKSPMAAAIGLYGLVADGEASAEIYACGKDKAQAFVLFRDAVSMVRQSPLLSSRIVPSGGTGAFVENLAYLKTASFFRVISREGASSGPRPTVALCDELHEHPNGDVIEMLERGFKFRRQPLLLMITNSGSDRGSICWDEHQHAVAVAAGVPKEQLDDDFTYVGETWDGSDNTFSYVCALDKDDDPFTDPSCWVKANPLLGVILDHKYMEGNVAQARDILSKRGGILRLHFCVWTESDTTWIPRPLVEGVMQDFDPYEVHKGRRINAAGLDLSGAIDLTAAAFVVESGTKRVKRADGTETDLPTYDAWIEAWTPRDTMDERSKASSLPYRQWYDSGYLHAPEGARIRHDHVAAFIAKVHADHGINVLAFDRYTFDKFEDELDRYGVDINCVMHPQGGQRRAKADPAKVEAARKSGEEAPLGLWMPGSMSALETLILEERIRIRLSPILLGAIMAVHVETDPLMGNQWLSRKKSTQKIDAAIALCMAVGAAVDGAAPVVTSVFELMAREQAAAQKINEVELRALEYVRNTGGNATVSGFDEDHEPIGPMLRAAIAGFIYVDSAGKVALTTAGTSALGGNGAQPPAAPVQTDEDEAAILANPRHPRWQEVRERYEARLSAASDDW